MRTEIIKDSSKENLFEGYRDESVEDKLTIEVDTNNSTKAFKELSMFLEFNQDNKDSNNLLESKLVLSPFEIHTLFQKISLIEDKVKNDLFSSTQGYINKLIQNSYDAGFNEFYLETLDSPISKFLGSKLKGTKENPIIFSFLGDVGNYFLSNSSYMDVTVKGNTGSFSCKNSDNINLIVDGSVKDSFGKHSININAIIKGDAGVSFGKSSEKLVTEIYGRVGKNFGVSSRNLTANVLGELDDGLLVHSFISTVFVKDSSMVPDTINHEYLEVCGGSFVISGNDIYSHKKYKKLQRTIKDKFQ